MVFGKDTSPIQRGMLGKKHSLEARKKMSLSSPRNKYWLGKKRNKEWLENHSRILKEKYSKQDIHFKGIKLTKEHIDKIRPKKGKLNHNYIHGNYATGERRKLYYYLKKVQPQKMIARQTLLNAVRIGKIQKPNKCESCSIIKEKRFIQAHHPDYSKPLEVKWLCRRCHDKITWGDKN